MELKPITRQEQIIAGKGLEPITRMEKFLKKFGGGGGGIFRINVTVTGDGESSDLGDSVFDILFDSLKGEATADKTYAEIEQAIASGLLPIVWVTQHDYDGDGYFICTLRWHNIVSWNGADENIYYEFRNAYVDYDRASGTIVTIRKNGVCEVNFCGHDVGSLLWPQ